MGRLKKYWTEEDKLNARKKRQMKYYWKNRSKIIEKNKEKYHKEDNNL